MRESSERHWLDLAEYASLAGSVAGTLAAVMSHQVVYAAAPLTLALSLNLANRQRFQQQSQQHTTNQIADVHQEIRYLHNKVHVLPANERVNNVEAQVRSLEQIVVDIDIRQPLDALVQAFKGRPELKEIGRLNEAIAQMHHYLEQLPPPTEPFDSTPLKHEIETLEQSITNLQESAAITITKVRQELSVEIEFLHTSIQSRLVPLEAIDHNHNAQALALFQTDLQALERNTKSRITSLQTQIDQNRQLIEDLPPPFDSSLLKQRVTMLEQNDDSVETKLEYLSMSVMQVRSGTASTEEGIALLRQQLDTVAQQLNTLAQQFNTRLELEKIDRLDVESVVPQTYFNVSASFQSEVSTATELSKNTDWQDSFEDETVRRVFFHLQQHGSITEPELNQILGSARLVRRFSLDFEEHLKKVPFSVRIETTSSGKRYVKQN